MLTESGILPLVSSFPGVAFMFSLSQATDAAEDKPSAIYTHKMSLLSHKPLLARVGGRQGLTFVFSDSRDGSASPPRACCAFGKQKTELFNSAFGAH